MMAMSGYEIASGNVSTVYGPSDPIPGRPLLYVTLGVAVVAFIIFLLSYFVNKFDSIFGFFQTIIGVIGLIPIFQTIAQMKSEFSEGMIPLGVDFQYGFWISVIGYAGITIGGLLSIADGMKKSQTSGILENPPNLADQLTQLVELHRSGVLSKDEFESAKKKLLSR